MGQYFNWITSGPQTKIIRQKLSDKIFQNSVYGDVVYAQTWEVLTLKNCSEPL